MSKIIQKFFVSALLIAFSLPLYSLSETEPNVDDCSHMAEDYKRAIKYWRSRYKEGRHWEARYKADGFKIFKDIAKLEGNPLADKNILALTAYAIAVSYWHGRGVGRDRKRARKLLHEFLEKYSQDAEFNSDVSVRKKMIYVKHLMAECAWKGIDEPKNPEKAVAMYQEVIEDPEVSLNDWAWSLGRLADAYREGTGVEQNQARSVRLFYTILHRKDKIRDKSIIAWAEYWIADDFQHGKSTVKDVQLAEQIFQYIVDTYDLIDPIVVEDAQKRLDEIGSPQ